MADQQQNITDQQQQNNTNLQENNTPDIVPIVPQVENGTGNDGAGDNTPEDTPNAYETIIAQQQAQISALIAQTNSLSGQINELIRGGAVITDNKQNSVVAAANATPNGLQGFEPPEDYIPLADLGAQIGKRD